MKINYTEFRRLVSEIAFEYPAIKELGFDGYIVKIVVESYEGTWDAYLDFSDHGELSRYCHISCDVSSASLPCIFARHIQKRIKNL